MRRFYVTLTWDDWPEGGSYGTVVSVPDDDPNPYANAEAQAKYEMAESRADEDDDAAYYLEHYGDEWEVVDNYDLDEHILMHYNEKYLDAARQRVAAREQQRVIDGINKARAQAADEGQLASACNGGTCT